MGKKDDIKVTINSTPPFSTLLGIKSGYKATDGTTTGYGSSKTKATADLNKKSK